jgi:hypothetical protein
LRKLRIGTYVQPPLDPDALDKSNRFYPIATATLTSRVFDVVHMFSERAISAVPIIDEDGVVVNLYETVDVIVSRQYHLPDLYQMLYSRHLFALELTSHLTLQFPRHSNNAHQIFLVL